jgi:hypothetical protein
MRKHWTADEDQEFLAMWNQGAPLAEIAIRFGRSENAVTQRRLILNLPTRRTPKIEDQSRDKRKEGYRPRRKVQPKTSILTPNRKQYFNSAAVLHVLADAVRRAA